jgi:hypothetical protein
MVFQDQPTNGSANGGVRRVCLLFGERRAQNLVPLDLPITNTTKRFWVNRAVIRKGDLSYQRQQRSAQALGIQRT